MYKHIEEVIENLESVANDLEKWGGERDEILFYRGEISASYTSLLPILNETQSNKLKALSIRLYNLQQDC